MAKLHILLESQVSLLGFCVCYVVLCVVLCCVLCVV